MSVDKKTLIGQLDATPKWAEIVDLLLDMLDKGTPEQIGTALNELRRMARAADAYVAVQMCINELAKIGGSSDAKPALPLERGSTAQGHHRTPGGG